MIQLTVQIASDSLEATGDLDISTALKLVVLFIGALPDARAQREVDALTSRLLASNARLERAIVDLSPPSTTP